MKIGILTFHCAHNYGAVLQAFATQEYLISKGYEVDIIDYCPEYLTKPYKIFDIERLSFKQPLAAVKKTLAELLKSRALYYRKVGFDRFINTKLRLSPKVDQVVPPSYDAYIFGSDQIWNPKISKGFDRVYFGDFNSKEGSRMISYAASMEALALNDSQKEFFRSALNRFSSLSVRESQLQSLLQPLTEKQISTVLDPTLLIGKETWEKLAVKPKIKQKYVLIYQVRANANTLRIASEIAKKIGGVVVQLVSLVRLSFDKHKYQYASPEEFVGWFRYADHIVTTSFHGTAFSIIFNKPFYTLDLKDGHDSRSSSILKKLDLLDRFIPKDTAGEISSSDFTIANDRLLELRIESERFLNSSIEN